MKRFISILFLTVIMATSTVFAKTWTYSEYYGRTPDSDDKIVMFETYDDFFNDCAQVCIDFYKMGASYAYEAIADISYAPYKSGSYYLELMEKYNVKCILTVVDNIYLIFALDEDVLYSGMYIDLH